MPNGFSDHVNHFAETSEKEEVLKEAARDYYEDNPHMIIHDEGFSLDHVHSYTIWGDASNPIAVNVPLSEVESYLRQNRAEYYAECDCGDTIEE